MEPPAPEKAVRVASQVDLRYDESEEPRLDRFLSAALPDLSRTRLQALIKSGGVTLNGERITRSSQRLLPGSAVRIELGPPPRSELEPENIPLDVLYEDDDMAAINKPAGLVVHAGAGHRQSTLVNALLYRYGTLSQVDSQGELQSGEAARPGIVHRLDRFTSGVILVARNDLAHRHLAEQFQRREIQKTYLALVHGLMPEKQDEIRLPIHRDLHNRARMTTRLRRGRDAHTSYRVREAFPAPAATAKALRSACSYSWLELTLHTGRTHQIRVHLSALGHPVVGDRLYGAPAALAGPGRLTGIRPERVMLHAARIRFTHPRTGKALDLSAPLPGEIAGLVAELQGTSVQG